MIAASHLAKSFKVYDRPADRLKEVFFGKPYHKHHQALSDISFQLDCGEALGVIGQNGAGKSTLLKILNGVLMPDSGTVTSSGRTAGLLELGTGFDPMLSGLQNICTNGLLLGMTESEINQQTANIVQFAELGSYIDEPLRTYSSGMTMRLGFAIAIHAQPQTLLIDEALSVGDAHFQQKCLRRIREFLREGGSIIFVSHDLNSVKMICNQVMVLNKGKVTTIASPEDAVSYYNQLLIQEHPQDQSLHGEGGNGDGRALIRQTRLAGETSGGALLTSGELAFLDVDIESRDDLRQLNLKVLVRDRFGQDIFDFDSSQLMPAFSLTAGQCCTLRVTLPMGLIPGKYTLSLSLCDGIGVNERRCHAIDNARQFEISGIRGPYFTGICNLAPQLQRKEKGQS